MLFVVAAPKISVSTALGQGEEIQFFKNLGRSDRVLDLPPSPGVGTTGSLAGKCVKCAQEALAANPGSKLIGSAPNQQGHVAVQLKDGSIVDPSLRDNLIAYGIKVDDIPSGKTIYTEMNGEQS